MFSGKGFCGVGGVGGAHASLNTEETVSLTCSAQMLPVHSAEDGIAWGQEQKPESKVNTNCL